MSVPYRVQAATRPGRTSRVIVAGGLVAALLAACRPDAGDGARPQTGDPPGASTGSPTPARSPQTAERVRRLEERWTESLELDLPAEVVEASSVLAEDAELAREGRLLALAARGLFAVGDEAAAADVLDGAAAGVRDAEWVEIERARLEVARDELDAAIARLGADVSPPPVRFPDIAEAWLVHGRALWRAGDLARARRSLEGFVELAPRHPEAAAAYRMLARCALAADKPGGAAAAQNLEQLAGRADRWHGYAVARRLQIREHPDDPLPRYGWAQLCANAGDVERATAILEEIADRWPDFCRAWSALGDLARRANDAEGARAGWTRALECDPELAEARYNRARLALLEGRPDEARADLELLVAGSRADDPKLAPAHLDLARLLVAAGESGAAQTRYRRYTELGGREPLAPRR